MVNLRPATADDAKAIKALIREVGINPLGLKWSRFVLAVDEANQLIGCGQVKPHGDDSLELASIAVRNARRHQGIAGAIIRHLQAAHSHTLWLTCRSSLIPFYEQYGFCEISDRVQMPTYFQRALRLFKLFTVFSRSQEYLAVMCWHP